MPLDETEELYGNTEQRYIAKFDGNYGREGIIYYDRGTCQICHTFDVKGIAIDNSNGEYFPGFICLKCCHKA